MTRQEMLKEIGKVYTTRQERRHFNTLSDDELRDILAINGFMSKEQAIQDIAERHCFVDTLERRGLDSLDFHDISVWALKSALEAAYEAGRSAKEAS